jgi:hypothetical protein
MCTVCIDFALGDFRPWDSFPHTLHTLLEAVTLHSTAIEGSSHQMLLNRGIRFWGRRGPHSQRTCCTCSKQTLRLRRLV